MKVVLFDIDGVLNYETRMMPGKLERELVVNLNQLVKPDVAFVVTSSWRYLIGLEKIREHLAEFGFTGDVIDVTDDLGEFREWQILRWLKGRDVESYVVLDDRHLVLPRSSFVQVQPLGLRAEHVNEALEKLGFVSRPGTSG